MLTLVIGSGAVGEAWGQSTQLPQPPPFSAEGVDQMVDHLYHGSPSRELASAAVCDAECSARLLAERQALTPVQTAAQKAAEGELRREMLWARLKAKLFPPSSGWWKPVRLTGGGIIAWQFGMATKKMWFGVDAPEAAQGRAGDIASAQLVSAGQVLAYGYGETTGYWDVRAPTVGWVGITESGSMVGTMVYDFHPGALWPPPPCVETRESSISYAGWEILTGAVDDAEVDCGTIIAHYEAPFVPLDVVRSDGTFPGAPEPFRGQPTSEPPIEFWESPWNLPGVRANVVQEVENNPGWYPMLRLWEAHQKDPKRFPDPRTFFENEDHHRCDLSPPALQNPDGNLEPEPFTEKIPTPFVTTGRPPGFEEAPDPYLRWGETEWAGQYIDNWDGFGWRHIVAKHGWSADDEAATRLALQAPVSTTPSRSGVSWYEGATYQQNGAICQRLVLVDYNVDSASGKPSGIRTSFGAFRGNGP